jgi:hypothetical protein
MINIKYANCVFIINKQKNTTSFNITFHFLFIIYIVFLYLIIRTSFYMQPINQKLLNSLP